MTGIKDIPIRPNITSLAVAGIVGVCSASLHVTRGLGQPLLAGYGKDVLEPIVAYTFLRGLFNWNPFVSASISFGYPAMCEIAQRYGLTAGTYDPVDFIAYAIGTGTGVILNEGINKFKRQNNRLENSLNIEN